MALTVQNVANAPVGSYPVGVFKTASGAELQAMVLVDTTGAATPSGSVATSGSLSAISVTTSNTVLAAASTTRNACTVFNTHATANLFVAYGFVATAANYSVKLVPGAYLEVPSQFARLAINGIGSASLTANVTTG